MKRLPLLLSVLAISASAQVTFNGTTYPNCSVTVTCGNSPAPAPAPAPPPPLPVTPPVGSCPAVEGTIVMQTMNPGGTNNYALDSLAYRNPPPGVQANGFPEATTPHNTVQVFPLSRTWPDGQPVTSAVVTFTDYIYFNLAGAQYEVSLSPCKGDFTSYKTAQTYHIPYNGTFTACGGVFGPSFSVRWGAEGNFMTCQIPANEQWYLNWRVVPGTCKTGYGKTCGQTFGVQRG